MMVGEVISIEQIEGLGWYELFTFGYNIKVYANNHHRIMVDITTLEVVNIYII